MTGGGEGVICRTLDRVRLDAVLPVLREIGRDADVRPWTDENYRAERPEKWALSFTVETGAGDRAGTIVGYAVLSRLDAGTVHLHHVAVAPEHRGAGVGPVLFAEMARRSREAGARTLSLKVNRSQDRLAAHYRRIGFVPVGEEGDHLRMQRAVGPA